MDLEMDVTVGEDMGSDSYLLAHSSATIQESLCEEDGCFTKSDRKSSSSGALAALSCMILSECLSETIVYPFAPFMISHFRVTDEPTRVGYYAGFLATAFYSGTVIASPVLGSLSDRIGRKPVLIIGVTVNVLCAFLFGFSTSFPMAVAARFLNGLFNCVLPVSKTVVFEICDPSDRAFGFAVIGGCWGVAFLLGPALGGLLCQPVTKFPHLFSPDSLFATFPFAPPCLIVAVASVAALICSYFCLPETLGFRNNRPIVSIHPEDPPQPTNITEATEGETETQELLSPPTPNPPTQPNVAATTVSEEGVSRVAVSPGPDMSVCGPVKGALARAEIFFRSLSAAVGGPKGEQVDADGGEDPGSLAVFLHPTTCKRLKGFLGRLRRI